MFAMAYPASAGDGRPSPKRKGSRCVSSLCIWCACFWPGRSLLRELHLQCVVGNRMAHLRIVEGRHAEVVRLGGVVELDVVLAAGHELACDLERPFAVLPAIRRLQIGAVAKELEHDV